MKEVQQREEVSYLDLGEDRRRHWWMSFIWVRWEDLRGAVGRSLIGTVWCGSENVARTKGGAEKSTEAAESIEIAGSRGLVCGVENVDWSPQAESTGSGCPTRKILGLSLMMCPSSSSWYFRNWTESDELFLQSTLSFWKNFKCKTQRT